MAPRLRTCTRAAPGQLVGTPILGREFLALCAGRPADDVAAVAAGKGRGFVPWPRVGYRTLDGENAAVEVRDDQVKRLGVGLSHGIFLSRITLAGQAAGECASPGPCHLPVQDSLASHPCDIPGTSNGGARYIQVPSRLTFDAARASCG